MGVKVEKKLKWVPIEDWSDLKASITRDGVKFVTEKDFDIFADKAIKDAISKIGIPYELLQDQADDENIFFRYKKIKLFKVTKCYPIFDPCLNSLKRILLIPILKEEQVTVSVQELIRNFYSLTEDEKKYFLNSIY